MGSTVRLRAPHTTEGQQSPAGERGEKGESCRSQHLLRTGEEGVRCCQDLHMGMQVGCHLQGTGAREEGQQLRFRRHLQTSEAGRSAKGEGALFNGELRGLGMRAIR